MSEDRHFASVGVATSGGVSQVCGNIAALCAAVSDVPGTLLAVGDEGLLVTAIVAARIGRDMAFWRYKRKDHGTEQQLEGVIRDGPYTAIGTRGQRFAPPAGVAVQRFLTFADQVPGCTPLRTGAPVTPVRSAPARTREPGAAAAALHAGVVRLSGNYLRQNGTRSGYYYDTLPPAHNYQVVRLVADLIAPQFAAGAPVYGIHSGGVYSAAVVAQRNGSVAAMIKAKSVTPGSLAPGIFLDDFVLSGADMLNCERAVRGDATAAAFISLYALQSSVSLEKNHVRALAVLPSGNGG